MKKRLLVLFLTLVMLVPVLPAAVLADTQEPIPELIENEIFYDDLSIGPGFTIATTGNSATLEGNFVDKTWTDFRCLENLNVFTETQDEYLIQDICIEKMPVFSTIHGGNAHVTSGFFMACNRNYRDAGMDYIKHTIYRTDDEGNLAIALAKKSASGSIVYEESYPLGKKVGETFRLMTVWHLDGSVEIYCDGTLIHSYDQTATYIGSRNSARKNFLRIGYCAMGAETTAATSMDVKITISNFIRGNIPEHVHTPAEDDGDCTTAVKCTTCDEIAIEASPAHRAALANYKRATETEKGYSGDRVCYLCDYVFSMGEETPMLAKSALSATNNQNVNNIAIYVYIAIGAVVLAAAAVVVIVVIRKKQNRKAPTDPV